MTNFYNYFYNKKVLEESCNQNIYLRLVVVIVLAGFSYLAVFELTDDCFKKDATYIQKFRPSDPYISYN